MAHSDHGHPSVWSSGPIVPIAIKKKRREGCLRCAFPEAPPPLTRMKKKQKEEKAMIRTAMSLPGLPILVPLVRGSSGRSHPSFPLAIPERRTRRIKRLALPDRRPFQAREQFADNVNSDPDVAHGDSQLYPIGRGVETSHPKYSRISLEQFADNVNSHPTLLRHGNPNADPNRPRGRGKIPGSQRSASQVINHRTIS